MRIIRMLALPRSLLHDLHALASRHLASQALEPATGLIMQVDRSGSGRAADTGRVDGARDAVDRRERSRAGK